jgi:hypothetical protein
MDIILKGLTGDHPRGYAPLVAGAEEYVSTLPGLEIHCDRRSLRDFGKAPIENLIGDYDLLIVDHPFVGFASAHEGLSWPPGLSPLFISKRALKWWGTRQSPRPRWYFDIKLIHDYASVTHRYRHTAPISMFHALREALLVIAEEGAQNRWAVIAGDTVSVPSGIDDAKARKRLFDD